MNVNADTSAALKLGEPVRLAGSKGRPTLPFHVTTLRAVCQPVPASWVCMVVLLAQSGVSWGVPSARKTSEVALSVSLHVLGSYTDVKEVSPDVAMTGLENENDVVKALREFAMFVKAAVNEFTIWVALPVSK